MIGPVPILFVSAGACAERTLGALSQMAREMAAPAQGPFGLLSLDPVTDALLVSHWTWLSDFEVPTSPEVCGLSEDVARSDERLLGAVSSLIRQLRSTEPVADPASPGRVRMSCYVIIDLSVAEAVSGSVRLMRIVRRADQGHDMAVVGLTGRTATSGAESDDAWFDRWKELLTQLQDEPLAQKLYLLDGCNAHGTWLDRPEQLHRLAAEFLLHHGIACRGPLRQAERRRVSPKENILNICGSFGVRRIAVDLPEVAERVARRLVCDDLADLYQQRLSEESRGHIEEGAQALAEEIEHVYDRARQAASSSSNGTVAEPGECVLRNTDVSRAIQRSIDRLCARNPLVSVCHLLKCLQPRLRSLLTRYRLVERDRTRRFVGETLQRQQEETYGPMTVWLSKADTEWDDRFTPAQGPPSHVAVSRIPARTSYRAGLTLLIVGLVGVTSGLFLRERTFALGGGLLSLGAGVLMTLPTGWARQERHKVPQGREIPKSIPSVSYRRRLPWVFRCGVFVLAAIGVTATGWSLWPDMLASARLLAAGISAFVGLIGAGILLAGPVQIRPDQVKVREAPDHQSPPVWGWRIAGLLCLGGAWIVFCLGASGPVRVDTASQWGLHLGGLACLIAAAALGLRPRVGCVRLVERIPKVPEAFSGGMGAPVVDSDAIREIDAVTQWIGRVALDPEKCGQRGGPGGVAPNREVLFDLLAPDWDRRLVKAFRRALASRSNETFGDLAKGPRGWSSCVVRQLQEPSTECSDLAVIFALEAVNAWIDSLTLKDLATCLDVDLVRFNSLVTQIASPNWPATRVAPEVSVGVVVAGKALGDLLKPLAQAQSAPSVVALDANPAGDGVVVLRIVQGLTQGWRGYPALPGQQREFSPSVPASSGESDNRGGSTHVSSSR